eukprot:TRINITY_DN8348_c0_g1_i17.p1 TRINITY_DN8348_c0_g1~~TRINITY_DN8348_c0_g1_i17.p1  ORF type:complete len:109 (-),score=12.52 TRINITY_DN8348_c0_g1_i17:306-632(-)
MSQILLLTFLLSLGASQDTDCAAENIHYSLYSSDNSINLALKWFTKVTSRTRREFANKGEDSRQTLKRPLPHKRRRPWITSTRPLSLLGKRDTRRSAEMERFGLKKWW